MKNIISLIISLNFNPGHVSHLVASYEQCKELGYNSYYLVAKEFLSFLPKDGQIITLDQCCPDADLAIFLFPSQKNLPLIWKLKRKGCKIVYIFHEPLAPIKVYFKSGFSLKYISKLWVINYISALTVKMSNIILVPSNKALRYYKDNNIYKNINCYYMPLMYPDERMERFKTMPRRYFSYIGTIAADHSFAEYISFIKWAIDNRRLPGLDFLIATKSEFDVPESLRRNSRVKIQKGQPMTDDEINRYYASTYVVWNAYVRTTQSGVLAKSFMFGTPALVMRQNLNEFMHDGYSVVAINDNTNFEEIELGICQIISKFELFSNNARTEFERLFYYRQYNEQIEQIINKCK